MPEPPRSPPRRETATSSAAPTPALTAEPSRQVTRRASLIYLRVGRVPTPGRSRCGIALLARPGLPQLALQLFGNDRQPCSLRLGQIGQHARQIVERVLRVFPGS